MVELRLAALGLRKHLCILSNFQYVAIIGQTDWEKLEMLQRNTFKIWSLKVFKGKKHFSKIHSIWELTWKIVLRSNWIPSYLTLSCVWICWTTNYCENYMFERSRTDAILSSWLWFFYHHLNGSPQYIRPPIQLLHFRKKTRRNNLLWHWLQFMQVVSLDLDKHV